LDTKPTAELDRSRSHSHPQAQGESYEQTRDLTFYRQPTTSFFSVTLHGKESTHF